MKADISGITRYNGLTIELDFNETLFNGNEPAEGIKIEKPVRFKGMLTNVNGMLQLTGKLNFEYKIGCFRCLKDLEEDMEVKIGESYVNGKQQAEELDAYTYAGNLLDLDKAIEDNIVLNLPMRKLCRHDCKGLCRICGADLNEMQCGCTDGSTNPQMDKLRDYLKN
ncbi:MAG: DUF177 domain-containing protein [Clostridiales bacterium]|nr:DUF177 domain-containing protein [Clostridiales bacterium]